MTKRILICEDEKRLADLLVDYFHHAGFSAESVERGEDAVETVRNGKADVLILDLMLPGMDGLQACREIRSFSDIPVLMVTARVDEVDRLLGLELGADDYICKPFSPREVVARVKAILRRLERRDQLTGEQGLELDRDRHELRLEGKRVPLTAVEFALMEALASQPGRIWSRQSLMNLMYTDHRIVSDRTIDSHIRKLRRKLEQEFGEQALIGTVYGVGYRLELE